MVTLAIVAFLHFDPAAPDTVWNVRAPDPSRLESPRGLQRALEARLFHATEPWGVLDAEVRDAYWEDFVELWDEVGRRWPAPDFAATGGPPTDPVNQATDGSEPL